MPEQIIKPPIGIMPEKIWKRHRIQDLALAIRRQFGTMGYHPNYTLIEQWSDEIRWLASDLREVSEEGNPLPVMRKTEANDAA